MNLNRFLVFLFILITPSICDSQIIDHFSGTTISNKKVEIPLIQKDKFSLLFFAISPKSQKDLESWLDPIYQKYIAKTGIMDDAFDVNVFFVPLIKSTNTSLIELVKRKFRENTQEDFKSHILFLDTPSEKIISDLRLTDQNIPYIFLLNKEGKILFRSSGAYSDEKFDQIDEMIE